MAQYLDREISHRFTYHDTEDPRILNRYIEVRDTAKAFARLLTRSLPDCRELSIALTKLEETVMWANAGIARNQEKLIARDDIEDKANPK